MKMENMENNILKIFLEHKEKYNPDLRFRDALISNPKLVLEITSMIEYNSKYITTSISDFEEDMQYSIRENFGVAIPRNVIRKYMVNREEFTRTGKRKGTSKQHLNKVRYAVTTFNLKGTK